MIIKKKTSVVPVNHRVMSLGTYEDSDVPQPVGGPQCTLPNTPRADKSLSPKYKSSTTEEAV